MKQSVADQTPTPAKIPRRHTDPPFLWISLGVFSFSLHVLAVQLFYGSPQSNSNSILRQQSNNAIPIEILEIPPKATTVPFKSQVDSQKSDGDGINFGYIPKVPVRKRNFRPLITPKPKPIPRKKPPRIIIQPVPTPTSTPTAKPVPTPTSTPTAKPVPTPTSTPTAKPFPTPTSTPTAKPFPTPTSTPTAKPVPTPTFTPIYPEQPGNISTGKETPLPEFTPTFTPSPTTTPTLPQLFTASFKLLTDVEQRQISRFINILDKLPRVLGGVELTSVEAFNEPFEFNVILSISDQGNFIAANVLKNQVPAASIDKYVEIANKMFKNAKFTPGSTKDGITPPESQMVVRIVIQPNSKQP